MCFGEYACLRGHVWHVCEDRSRVCVYRWRLDHGASSGISYDIVLFPPIVLCFVSHDFTSTRCDTFLPRVISSDLCVA